MFACGICIGSVMDRSLGSSGAVTEDVAKLQQSNRELEELVNRGKQEGIKLLEDLRNLRETREQMLTTIETLEAERESNELELRELKNEMVKSGSMIECMEQNKTKEKNRVLILGDSIGGHFRDILDEYVSNSFVVRS
ncbi:unnamed protein product [Ceutorhynchus assimilis]|uniref:Uncharacterized protein n=1 Tax=Ceutorhynchus assimilis TaxID=467358 RepID=A0A9N9QNS6_9CUCU|nr:unnamed protein product [Ceutorhynchus assimilis]